MARRRPTFVEAWTAFKEIDGDGSLAFVGAKIGGKVKENFDMGANGGFTNGCATRMSYVFNHAGSPITSGSWSTVSGGDGKLYIFRVADFIRFIHSTFGPPDKTYNRPSATGMTNERGLLVFEVHIWSDASGHVTLWNGNACSDHCYFPQSTRAFLWRLQ